MSKKKSGACEPTEKNAIHGNSKYTEALGLKVYQKLIDGKTVLEISELKGMPHHATIYEWLKNPKLTKFHDLYARAREIQAHRHADEILKISDDTQYAESSEAIQAARLRVDTRKWIAAKIVPKLYGDKLQNEVTGKDGSDLIPVINVSIKPND